MSDLSTPFQWLCSRTSTRARTSTQIGLSVRAFARIGAGVVLGLCLAVPPGSAARKLALPAKGFVAETPNKKVSVTASPSVLIDQRAQKTLALLKSRPVRSLQAQGKATEIVAPATRAGFVSSVYTNRLVEASWATEMLADKRIVYEVLKRELGEEKAQALYPKTLGLREFLVKHGFLAQTGAIKKDDVEEIEAALYEEFPNGFLARVAVGVSPRETSRGLYPSTDAFLVELMKPSTPIYRPNHATHAVSSHILGSVASGEAIVLQENFVATSDAKKALKNKFFQEVRVHTYEAKVVANARPTRWVQKDILSDEQNEKAEKFVADFLAQLPLTLLSRQAWSVDVAVLDNGDMKINDIVTNRGEKVGWSSYLEQPHVIAAYVRHFEQNADVHYAGVSGWFMRHGFANYFAYWNTRIQKARPGVGKVLAYLPPWPRF